MKRKKLLHFKAVVFFVVFAMGVILNGRVARAEAKCVFDSDKEEAVENYCKNEKVDQAIKDATSHFTSPEGVVSCDFEIKNPSGGGYEFVNSCAKKEVSKHWDFNIMSGTPYPRRILCGWENVLIDINNTDFNNMSSCEAASGGDCTLDKDWKEKICNSFTIEQCESDHNIKTHGCKLESDMKNACYCNNLNNSSELIFENGNVVTALGKQMTKDYCVDFPFSQIKKFSKCVWYVDDKEIINGTRTASMNNQIDHGCWCTEKGETTETYYMIYDQADCMSWTISSVDPLDVCMWKENGKVIEKKTIGAKTGTVNGCYCTTSTSTEPSFINILEKAKIDFTPNDSYYFGQWTFDNSPEGKSSGSCVDIVNFGAYATCAWVETGKIIEKKTGNLQKKGCFCNLKESPNVMTINWKKTGSMENCLAASQTQYNPKCEWWENGAMVSSSINIDVLYKKPTPEIIKTPAISFEEYKKEAESLNPMKFATGQQGVLQLIGRATRVLMYAMGSILFTLYIYAGFLWLSSAGNSERVGTAKKILVWSTLGVIVQLSAYILVTFVFKFTGGQ
ncbi:MAG: hypothetical protein Q7S24_00650 [bacterium]|nr:hypothetical protein [bacterium]